MTSGTSVTLLDMVSYVLQTALAEPLWNPGLLPIIVRGWAAMLYSVCPDHQLGW